MGTYDYRVYNTQFNPRRFLLTIEANSPTEAIKKAGFDWIRADGGKIEKTRKGAGFTNTTINVFLAETVAAGKPIKPDFIFERIM